MSLLHFDLGPSRCIAISCVTGLYDSSILGLWILHLTFIPTALYIPTSMCKAFSLHPWQHSLLFVSENQISYINEIKSIFLQNCTWHWNSDLFMIFQKIKSAQFKQAFFLCIIHNSKISPCDRIVKSSEKQFATISNKKTNHTNTRTKMQSPEWKPDTQLWKYIVRL